jgi:hypothetical protein
LVGDVIVAAGAVASGNGGPPETSIDPRSHLPSSRLAPSWSTAGQFVATPESRAGLSVSGR